jgi:hypothetical protein
MTPTGIGVTLPKNSPAQEKLDLSTTPKGESSAKENLNGSVDFGKKTPASIVKRLTSRTKTEETKLIN